MDDGPVTPVADADVRRAWRLLCDPFATPSKGVRTLLLLGWLAWFPPRQWTPTSLVAIIPWCAAALAVGLLCISISIRRRAAVEDPGFLAREVDRTLAAGRHWLALTRWLSALLVVLLAAGLLQLSRRSQPLTTDDLAVPLMGALIVWGILEGGRHHRRAARLLGRPSPTPAPSP